VQRINCLSDQTAKFAREGEGIAQSLCEKKPNDFQKKKKNRCKRKIYESKKSSPPPGSFPSFFMLWSKP
jgi:hypothetical protein